MVCVLSENLTILNNSLANSRRSFICHSRRTTPIFSKTSQWDTQGFPILSVQSEITWALREFLRHLSASTRHRRWNQWHVCSSRQNCRYTQCERFSQIYKILYFQPKTENVSFVWWMHREFNKCCPPVLSPRITRILVCPCNFCNVSLQSRILREVSVDFFCRSTAVSQIFYGKPWAQ